MSHAPTAAHQAELLNDAQRLEVASRNVEYRDEFRTALRYGAAALRASVTPAQKRDEDGAELIHQAIPDVEGTLPRPNEWVAPEGYWAYHEQVIAAARKQLLARWGIPKTLKERDAVAMAVRFFDVECTYDDEFARGDDPAEVAEANIEASDWE